MPLLQVLGSRGGARGAFPLRGGGDGGMAGGAGELELLVGVEPDEALYHMLPEMPAPAPAPAAAPAPAVGFGTPQGRFSLPAGGSMPGGSHRVRRCKVSICVDEARLTLPGAERGASTSTSTSTSTSSTAPPDALYFVRFRWHREREWSESNVCVLDERQGCLHVGCAPVLTDRAGRRPDLTTYQRASHMLNSTLVVVVVVGTVVQVLAHAVVGARRAVHAANARRRAGAGAVASGRRPQRASLARRVYPTRRTCPTHCRPGVCLVYLSTLISRP